MSHQPKHLAIIGGGPRAVSVTERIVSILKTQKLDQPVQISVIDPVEPGAGNIWATNQTRVLCMNTLAHAVTLYTEPGATITGPVNPGPTLYEWAIGVRAGLLPDPYDVATSFAAELKDLRPESHPSRALYGEYIRAVLARTLLDLPAAVSVNLITDRVTAVAAPQAAGAPATLTLASGEKIEADYTIIASGWEKPALTQAEAQLAAATAAAGLTWIQPDNPVEQEVAQLPAGEQVIVRGLGMGFFDLMALVTLGRGGKFVGDPTGSDLTYQPSGKEPILLVTSGRGYPYLPKSLYHSLPPKADLPRLTQVIAAHAQTSGLIDFAGTVYPAVIRDAAAAFYATLQKVAPDKVTGSWAEITAAIDASSPESLLAGSGGQVAALAAEHPSLAPYTVPAGLAEDELQRWFIHRLEADLFDAQLGTTSAQKAFLWAISAARKPISILGEGRYSFAERSNLYASTMALGQMIGSGPPAFRTAQLLALVKAGIVRLLGSRPQLEIAAEGFQLRTAQQQQPVTAKFLADAWMHNPDARRPAPGGLTASLLAGGQARLYQHPEKDGSQAASASLEVDPATRRLVRPDGSLSPQLALIGIPTWDQLPDTTISPMPGTDPLMLQETDKAAVAALQALNLLG